MATLENPRRSVLQDWVMVLPLRMQGVLLTGVRSCDLSPKHPGCIDEAHGCSTGEQTTDRQLTAFLRWCFMVPADVREVDVPGAFMRSKPPANWKPSEMGHYPLHWVMHLVHGFQVVAYGHPDTRVAGDARNIYNRFVKSFHLNIETLDELEDRMSEDRIDSGAVVS
jgi:hypothetical protein